MARRDRRAVIASFPEEPWLLFHLKGTQPVGLGPRQETEAWGAAGRTSRELAGRQAHAVLQGHCPWTTGPQHKAP